MDKEEEILRNTRKIWNKYIINKRQLTDVLEIMTEIKDTLPTEQLKFDISTIMRNIDIFIENMEQQVENKLHQLRQELYQ